MPKEVSVQVKNWTNVQIIGDFENSATFSKEVGSDGMMYNKLFAIFSYDEYLTRGFPITNIDHFTIWLQKTSRFIEKDVTKLWQCDPIIMEIKNFLRGDVVFGDSSDHIVTMLQDKMQENLQENITPDKLKWQRMQRLTLDIFPNMLMDSRSVEPEIIINALKNLNYLCFCCHLFNQYEYDALRNMPIPNTWELEEVIIGEKESHFIYTPKRIRSESDDPIKAQPLGAVIASK